MENLWVQLAVIIGIQMALGVIVVMVSGLYRNAAERKLMPKVALKYGVTVTEVEYAVEEAPEKYLKFMMDWASDDKWENRFANLIGLLLKPFGFIAKVVGWGSLIIPLSVLVGESTFAQGIEYGWMVTGGLVAWTFFVLAIDAINYAITGRRAGAPAEVYKALTAEWDMHIRRKQQEVHDALNWEFADA